MKGGDSAMNMAPVPRLLLSVEEAAAACGIGRTRMYELLRADRIIGIRIGRRTLVPVTSIEWFVEQLKKERGY
jgi:excisionase family DNA binding protein